jgi:anti-sigma B factor antagonist
MAETDQADTNILTLEIEHKADEAVIRLHGKLIAEVSTNFHDRVRKMISEKKRIVLDLADLNYIDSIGLGALVRLLVSAKTKGCSLELLHLGKRVRQILDLTHALGCFTVIGEQGITTRF